VVLAEGEGLAAGVRLRIALDLLEALAEEGVALDPRGPKSRLLLSRVRVDGEGIARAPGDGDLTGAAEVAWEILAARSATDGTLPSVRSVMDDLPETVDEVLARALRREGPMTTGELALALEDASRGYLDTHDDVRAAVKEWLRAPVATAGVSVAPVVTPEPPRAAAPPPPPPPPPPAVADPFPDLELDAKFEAKPEPASPPTPSPEPVPKDPEPPAKPLAPEAPSAEPVEVAPMPPEPAPPAPPEPVPAPIASPPVEPAAAKPPVPPKTQHVGGPKPQPRRPPAPPLIPRKPITRASSPALPPPKGAAARAIPAARSTPADEEDVVTSARPDTLAAALAAVGPATPKDEPPPPPPAIPAPPSAEPSSKAAPPAPSRKEASLRPRASARPPGSAAPARSISESVVPPKRGFLAGRTDVVALLIALVVAAAALFAILGSHGTRP